MPPNKAMQTDEHRNRGSRLSATDVSRTCVNHSGDIATVSNAGDAPLVLVVEPWAREYQIPPGVTYSLVAESLGAGKLEIERRLDCVVCWAWPGSVVELRCDTQVVDSLDTPVPDLPQGMSVRSCMQILFGDGKAG